MATDLDLASSFIPALHRPVSLLPIARTRNSLLYTIETYPVTIVIGQTGSGKSTQLPQYLQDAGWCKHGKVVAVTQPRRVAATTVAARVAEEMRCSLGEEVGYSIRFEDVTSSRTKIKFLTDGLLLREALADPLLSRYSVIMVDEAHERSISSDILIGVLKKILRKRPELRVIISSATIQADEMLRFFSTPPSTTDTASTIEERNVRAISLEGRSFPVDILYAEDAVEDYVESALTTVFSIHASEPEGDILVFLTGREEIDEVVQQISERAAANALHRPNAPALLPMPLYAGLTIEQQMYVFEAAPENSRKVIVATNIAEASVTIDRIVYVIDCGFVKLRAFNPQLGIDVLTATPISQASATQRAGRAGRTSPGKCFRLYTQATHDALAPSTIPELQRSNLAPVLLQLKALGIDNVLRFPFLSPPPALQLSRALEQLYALGALDDYAKLTRPIGVRMADLQAVEPMMARALLASITHSCLTELLSIAALSSLQGGSSTIFLPGSNTSKPSSTRGAFAAEQGDHLTSLNVLHAFTHPKRKDEKWCRTHHLSHKSLLRAQTIRAQLRRALERTGIDVAREDPLPSSLPSTHSSTPGRQSNTKGPATSEQIRRSLVAGYFPHAARMQADGTFRSICAGGSAALGEITLYPHPSSLMFNRKADWVVFHEVVGTAGSGPATSQRADGGKIFIRDITAVEKAWLVQESGGYYLLK